MASAYELMYVVTGKQLSSVVSFSRHHVVLRISLNVLQTSQLQVLGCFGSW